MFSLLTGTVDPGYAFATRSHNGIAAQRMFFL